MAARLPSAQDLGREIPTSNRSIVTADMGRVARATSNAGEQLAAFGEQTKKKKDRFELARAKSYWLNEQIKANSEFENDEDYTTMGQRYGDRLLEAKKNALGMVNDPELQQEFELDLGNDYERGLAGVKQLATKREREFGRATYEGTTEENKQLLLQAPDEPTRMSIINSQQQLTQSARDRQYLSPEEFQREGRKFVEDYATLRGATEVQADPKGALKLLKPIDGKTGASVSDLSQTVASKYKGVSPTYLTTTMAIETGGTFDPQAKNAKSGAAGLFQIIPSTAAELGVKDPHDPQQAVEGGAKLASQNLPILRKALGRAPSDAELYLAQQQGGGGASALLKNPEMKAVDALQTLKVYAGKPEKARAAIVQNGGSANMTAKEFSDMWASKYADFEQKYAGAPEVRTDGVQVASLDGGMGEVVKKDGPMLPYFEKTGTWVDYLPYDKRLALVNQAESQIRQNRVVNRQLLESKVKDATSMAMQGFADKEPPTLEDFEDAYDGPEAELRYREYMSTQGAAKTIYESATMTPAQQVAALEAAKPKVAQPGFAEEQKNYEALQKGIGEANTARKADPIAFAQKYNLTEGPAAQPLDFENPETLNAQLAQRGELGVTMNKQYATPVRVFTESEAASLSNYLNGQTATKRLGFLNSMQSALSSNPDAYVAAMGQLRAGSSVTAIAGTYLGLKGTVKDTYNAYAVTGGDITPQSVATMLLQGEDLINPPKNSEGKEQKPAMKLPSEDKMRTAFAEQWGPAFRGQPQAAEDAYQAMRAYYAALSARAGAYETDFDGDRFTSAMTAVMGNTAPVEVGDGVVTAPWGMDEDTFLDGAQVAFNRTVQAEGVKGWNFDDVTLVNTGQPGQYIATNGTTSLMDKNGRPVLIKVTERDGMKDPNLGVPLSVLDEYYGKGKF